MALMDETIVLRSDVICRAEDWDFERISQALWRRDLEREAFEADVYERVLAVWNASDLEGLELFEDFIFGAFDAVDAFFSSREVATSGISERLDCVRRIAKRSIVAMRLRKR